MQLVHPRPHRAGRSRSRIREPHQPVHLGSLRPHFRSRAHRPRARRPQSLRPHLDHHALDHPGQHGHRLSSEVRVCCGRSRARRLHRRRRPAESHRRKARLGRSENHRPLSRLASSKAPSSAILSSSAIRSASSADHVTLEQGTGAVHTAPGHGQEDFDIGAAVRHRDLLPGGRRRPLLSRRRRSRTPARRDHRQDRLAGQPARHRHSAIARRAARPGDDRAQLSALLALPQRPPSSAPPNSGSSAWTATISAPARSKPSSKVKWLPAWGEERISNMIATRPDWCISRQRVWGVPIIVFYCEDCHEPLTDRKILDRVVDQFRQHTADVWYEQIRRRVDGRGRSLARAAADTNSAKRPTSSTSGSIPAPATWPCSRPKNGLPWPSDMYLEGGDQYRGWFHSSLLIGVGLRAKRRTRNAPPTAGRSTSRAARCRNRSATASSPKKIIKKYGADVLRLWVASVDFYEDVAPLRHHSEAPVRSLPRNCATRLPLRARQPLRFRSRRQTPSGYHGNAGDRPLDSVRAEELVAQVPRLVRRVRVPQGLSRGLRFRDHRPERRLLRRAEGPPLHRRAPSHARRSAQTAIYRITYALVRLLAPLLTFTTDEVWGELRKPAGCAGERASGALAGAEELTPASDRAQRERLAQLGPPHGSARRSSESARNRPPGKAHRRAARSSVHLTAPGDLYPLLQRIRRRPARAVHRFAGAIERREQGALGCDRARRRRQVRALLEVHQ